MADMCVRDEFRINFSGEIQEIQEIHGIQEIQEIPVFYFNSTEWTTEQKMIYN
jgi:hypothetical protein